MKLVDWHPEDLIDKRHAGTLNDEERGRLEEHVEACSACRFEVLVGDDLDDEDGEEQDVSELVLAAVAKERAEVSKAAATPSRRAPRIGLGVLLAAAVLVAGSAAALYSTGGDAAPVTDSALAGVGDSVSDSVAKAARLLESADSADSDAADSDDGDSAEAAAATSAPQLESTSASLFASANAARRAGKREVALGLYRQLQQRFPGSDEAKLSKATVGRMMLDADDPQAALDSFDGYLDAGKGGLSEEALVGRAQALQRLGNKAEERAAWQELLAKHPKSIHAARARSRLAELAQHE
jgi:hypothetical protein